MLSASVLNLQHRSSDVRNGIAKGMLLSSALVGVIFFFELAFFPSHLFQRAKGEDATGFGHVRQRAGMLAGHGADHPRRSSSSIRCSASATSSHPAGPSMSHKRRTPCGEKGWATSAA